MEILCSKYITTWPPLKKIKTAPTGHDGFKPVGCLRAITREADKCQESQCRGSNHKYQSIVRTRHQGYPEIPANIVLHIALANAGSIGLGRGRVLPRSNACTDRLYIDLWAQCSWLLCGAGVELHPGTSQWWTRSHQKIQLLSYLSHDHPSVFRQLWTAVTFCAALLRLNGRSWITEKLM